MRKISRVVTLPGTPTALSSRRRSNLQGVSSWLALLFFSAPLQAQTPAPSETEPQPAPPASDAEGTTNESAGTAGAGNTPGEASDDAEPVQDGTEATTAETPEPAPSEPPPVVTPATPPPTAEVPPPATTPTPLAEEPDAELGAFPQPTREEPTGPEADVVPERDERIFAEDWWTHTRPAVELHGNFRVRSELYHQFDLGLIDPPGAAPWPRPLDSAYTDTNGAQWGAQACTPSEGNVNPSTDPGEATSGCQNPTQAGANMRFRIEPSIIISDNLRVRSQIDLFDNLVMGSTSQGNANFPAATGGYAVSPRGGYYPVSASSWSQDAAVTGINTVQDSIAVKRAWAEYETPVGQARFGRMPDHWGLGLVHNAGDDIDGDYQSTVDRIAFFTGLESLSLYAGGAWDFPYEGPTSSAFTAPGGQPYDVAQYDDVSAMNLMLFRRVNPQLEQRILSRGGVVLNGGLYLTYAFQRIANDFGDPSATCANGAAAIDCGPGEGSQGYVRRGFEQWTPDLYAEVKYKKFYAGVELVTHQGKLENTLVLNNDYENTNGSDGWRINQWAFAGEIEQRLVEDKLKLGFYFGWASGDPDVEGLVPPREGMRQQQGDRSFQTFAFHPGYRVDLILNRNILTRVQGSYYIKPMVQYDFLRKATGMKLGGRAEAIWTRASQFMQTPGHEHDLGIELNGTVYYQSSDGALNDSPDLLGGFYAMAQYGVLFPLPGLGYQSEVIQPNSSYQGLQTAQMVRLFLGVAY